MKRLMMLLTAAALMGGCKQNEDPKPIPGSPTSTLTAKINGNAWTAEEVAVLQDSTGLHIAARKDAGTGKESSVQFHLKQYTGLLTAYPIDSAILSDITGVYSANTGSLVITADNEVHMVGSFSFDAAGTGGSKTVTDGAFNYYKK